MCFICFLIFQVLFKSPLLSLHYFPSTVFTPPYLVFAMSFGQWSRRRRCPIGYRSQFLGPGGWWRASDGLGRTQMDSESLRRTLEGLRVISGSLREPKKALRRVWKAVEDLQRTRWTDERTNGNNPRVI